MGCCPSMMPVMTGVSLSDQSGYLTTRQSPVFPVKGTTLTLAALAENMTGTSPGLDITLWLSFDGGKTFKSTGSTLSLSAPGPKEQAYTNLTAALAMVQAVFAATADGWCDFDVYATAVSP